MPNTYTLIASNTVGSGGAATVTFSSIPSTYTDLLLKVSARSDASRNNEDLLVSFNGSTSNRTWRFLEGNGATATSASGTDGRFSTFDAATSTANTFGSAELYMPNYASSNYKSVSIDTVTENNATTAYAEIEAALWSNTAAINSIGLSIVFGTVFIQYSTFYLSELNPVK
jgi:hypothetical protein